MTGFHKTLLQVYRKNVVMMTAKQMAFGRYISLADSCNINLDECRAFFGDSISYAVSLLGTENENVQSWSWSWAQDDYKDTPVIKAAQKMHKLGVKQNFDILSSKSFDLSVDNNGYSMSILAGAMAKSDCMYTLESTLGVRAFLLLYQDGHDEFDGIYTEEDIFEAFQLTVYESEHASFEGLAVACHEIGRDDCINGRHIMLAGHTITFDRQGQCLGIEEGFIKSEEILDDDVEDSVEDDTEGTGVGSVESTQDDSSASQADPLQFIEDVQVEVAVGAVVEAGPALKEKTSRTARGKRRKSSRSGRRRR